MSTRRGHWWVPQWAVRLLDRAYWRAQDRALLKDPDLTESLRQMRDGETRRVR